MNRIASDFYLLVLSGISGLRGPGQLFESIRCALRRFLIVLTCFESMSMLLQLSDVQSFLRSIRILKHSRGVSGRFVPSKNGSELEKMLLPH